MKIHQKLQKSRKRALVLVAVNVGLTVVAECHRTGRGRRQQPLHTELQPCAQTVGAPVCMRYGLIIVIS